MKIAFQGRRGAYSESAGYHLFGERVSVHPVDTFEEIYQLVQSGEVQGGVIPIENSTAGSILDNYDLLLKYRLPIVSEVKLQIEHCLMALSGTSIADLRKVYSHPQALAQCSQFFHENPHAERVAFFDTAGSAEEIATHRLHGVGAIASRFAAEHYGLEVLREPMANLPGNNFTRFFGIQAQKPQIPTTGFVKSSYAFAPVANEAGVLYRCLGCFANRGINLVRIESRPRTGTPWEYVFYLDVEGDPTTSPLAEAIQELSKLSALLVHLGTYPSGQQRNIQFKENP